MQRLLHDDLKESGLLPVLARLVKAFNWRHQSRRHATDLVAAVHVVLRMLHHLNSSGGLAAQSFSWPLTIQLLSLQCPQ